MIAVNLKLALPCMKCKQFLFSSFVFVSFLVQPAFALIFSFARYPLCKNNLEFLSSFPSSLNLLLSFASFLLLQESISREEMLECVNSSKSIIWLISEFYFWNLEASCQQLVGELEHQICLQIGRGFYLCLSQGIQVTGWVV